MKHENINDQNVGETNVLKNNWKIIFFLLIAILGLLSYFSPYLTIYNMVEAAKDKDFTSLSTYIDLPEFRENLKSAMREETLEKIIENRNNGKDMEKEKALLKDILDLNNTGNAFMIHLAGSTEIIAIKIIKNAIALPRKTIELSMKYSGFNRFTVMIRGKETGDSMLWIMHREGIFSWKLSALTEKIKK